MWTLKICIIGLTMLCDTTTSNYITEAQCIQAMRNIAEINYIATCTKNE
jgi:hypothetical protein